MKHQQSGFTLIELVMVIVILGVLSATAIPRFTDLSAQAEQAATDGVAGALGAGVAVNVAVCAASSGATNCQTVNDCSNTGLTLQGGIPTGYNAPTGGAIASGGSTTCNIAHATNGTNADFTGLAP